MRCCASVCGISPTGESGYGTEVTARLRRKLEEERVKTAATREDDAGAPSPQLLGDPRRRIDESYVTMATIGTGAFASVTRRRCIRTRAERAVKAVKKAGLDPEAVDRLCTEVEVMIRIDHPNIVRFFECFETANDLYLVMELCTEGDFSTLYRVGTIPGDIRNLFRDVFSAVSHCHSLDIAHRDLKFENCAICAGGPRRTAKVLDFGLAAIRPHGAQGSMWMNKAVGSKYFTAPEVIDGRVAAYGVLCDLWSLGVMIYCLLIKEHPFACNAGELSTEAFFRTVLLSPLRREPLERLDPAAKELIEALLVKDPGMRISASNALREQWLQHDMAQKFERRPVEAQFFYA